MNTPTSLHTSLSWKGDRPSVFYSITPYTTGWYQERMMNTKTKE